MGNIFVPPLKARVHRLTLFSFSNDTAAETAKTPPPTLLFDNDSTWDLFDNDSTWLVPELATRPVTNKTIKLSSPISRVVMPRFKRGIQ
jgi:hypothetical protein